ncbi:hypothetical protein [Granulibacter bethesdensis]|uniref:Adhesin aidA-I n=1 Tax=Granulibacter bethesdensis (strain ATCC BAA-1260 / CGDNIH1) TaxID=391165 RepID=Q0BRP8_GRABC|nr:hypothetical protein [Granulibacter bethesdensis]ABI62504.1 Adhesin aidA-I [Granulibacter bethesdensis CGDNIH1]APG30704.1 Adhesin aidA-I [Granulibacter bethesdensis]APH52346.1 Adhesin aidA-I [Granulibacter bethesdensis]APH65040.1 Adhesin aidA-I [Granulibacter bethesdensis]
MADITVAAGVTSTGLNVNGDPGSATVDVLGTISNTSAHGQNGRVDIIISSGGSAVSTTLTPGPNFTRQLIISGGMRLEPFLARG